MENQLEHAIFSANQMKSTELIQHTTLVHQIKQNSKFNSFITFEGILYHVYSMFENENFEFLNRYSFGIIDMKQTAMITESR